jgi:alanyl-tRNA synthetase
VLRNTRLLTEVRATEEAIAGGAVALFGEIYGDRCAWFSIPGFQPELCGGTHVRPPGRHRPLSPFVSGSRLVAGGVRRIEAITGLESLRDVPAVTATSSRSVGSALTARTGEILLRVTALQDETKRLTRELQQARLKAASAAESSVTGRDRRGDSTSPASRSWHGA